MSKIPPLQAILVPQGAEYQAVCRGLSRINCPKPLVLPIPVGSKPFTQHLERLQEAGHFPKDSPPKILLMGLCGSLSPDYAIGDVVVYQGCLYQPNGTDPKLRSNVVDREDKGDKGENVLCPNATPYEPALQRECDRKLTTLLHDKLQERASLVRGLTSDRIIHSATEKHHLGQIYNTDVVDMEGFAALEVLSQAGVAVAMVRVISDDSHHNLPNLTSALSPDGSLLPLPLAIGMMRQPLAAIRLIRGAIQGLRVLQSVTTLLFSA